MHMFNSPSDAQLYERKVRENVDNLLNAFVGGDYQQAQAVLSWMQKAVATNACIRVGVDSGVSSSSPSFPLSFLKLSE